MSDTADIIYTQVDEAPELASSSFLPIIKAFASKAGINVGIKNISLAARIIAHFPDRITEEQKQSDDLAWLGEWVQSPAANVIKLPNISASVAQIKAAIAELQMKGFDIPNYPEQPKNADEQQIKDTFDTIKGSAVNPVLRQGNSDRRAAQPIKDYAKKHPHKMGEWKPDSKTNVAHMEHDDFFGSETSVTINEAQAGLAQIAFVDNQQSHSILKEGIKLEVGDVIDSATLNVQALRECIADAMQRAKQDNILLSLHLKCTMMKISDPIMFGHTVSVYFADLFKRHAETFKKLGINPNNGMSDVASKISTLPQSQQDAIKEDIKHCLTQGPDLAMVDSDKGITNLHVSSDVIVDASMAAAIRAGGKMWGPDGKEHDTLAIIPDRCYAGIYQAAIDFCRKHGAFDPTTMGSVANVGLMAQKAEEYGSHDKTFLAPDDGVIQVITESKETLLEQKVNKGDIFRSCTVKAAPIKDWVELSVNRARLSKTPVIFWLDENRSHDAELIQKVKAYLKDLDTSGLNIKILGPNNAMQETLEQVKAGNNVIAATGNVLRDYLTDLFPILELGTSAKMLSIVPLANGGGLFETGAGGSAPKHVQQFMQEGHLRWDSLGEFLALSESFAHLSRTQNNSKAQVLAKTLEQATAKLLDNNKSPGRKLGELSNNDSHFFEALYWAQGIAEQSEDDELKKQFTPIAKELSDNSDTILSELRATRGQSVDCGGYYMTDINKVTNVTRSSKTLNNILEQLVGN